MAIKFVLGLMAVAAVLSMAAPVMAEDKKKDEKKENPMVVIETSLGTVEVELFEDKSPETVKNFLGYVDDKFYDGLIFHRVIPTFMIQGGGFEPGMKQKKTKDQIKNESDNGVSNAKGTLAMARTKAADSATSQFFINVVDNERLDKANFSDKVGYCVFGKVTKGMEVVEKIRDVKTGTSEGFSDVPTEDVVIKSVTRKKK
jgi:cyclophilin family peptidyl-prolyl cis-trans isomerase